MRRYVQFYNESSGFTWINGKILPAKIELVEGMGSDSVFWLDGRNRLETSIEDAIKRAYILRNVAKYKAFKIMATPDGRFSNGKPITDLILL